MASMSVVELIPLDKGHRLILDPNVVTNIGRTPNIGCLDKKISRNHAELYVKSDGTVWVKPIHHNPTFFKTKTKQLMTLTKDQEHQLHDSDEIGLLPTEYFYRISIQSKDDDPPSPSEPSTISKPIDEEEALSPVKAKVPLLVQSPSEEQRPPEDPSLEPEGGVILHTKRALPVWMANVATPEAKPAKGRGKGSKPTTPAKTPSPSPSKRRSYDGRKQVDTILYDDDEEGSNEATPSTASVTTDPRPSKKRERCSYGKFCYRKNPIHLQQTIHPGDPDWDDKENDTSDTKPICPYGSECYRKNPEHFNEYDHTRTKAPRNSAKKRRASDDEEDDDDDGLPNEYDYHDSFIDDEELHDSMRVDRGGANGIDPDHDWRPHRKARPSANDHDEGSSTDDSELNLLREEAEEFVRGASTAQARPAKKKARLNLHDDQ